MSQSTFQAGNFHYHTKVVRGRQFLNQVECGVIIDDRAGVIKVSDTLPFEEAIEQTARAVSDVCLDAFSQPHPHLKAIASDGHLHRKRRHPGESGPSANSGGA